MDALAPYLPLAAALLLPILLWPLARAAGSAEANRMRALRDDLAHGRPHGIAVIAGVLVVIVMVHMWSAA
jgi:hypothetical protein